MAGQNGGPQVEALEAFAEDATLTDFGRTFEGRAEISRWNADENIGTSYRISVTGDVYNGPGTLIFSLRAGRIERLVITA